MVIFKRDDLWNTKRTREGFARVFGVVRAKGGKAGVVVIADSCEHAVEKMLQSRQTPSN